MLKLEWVMIISSFWQVWHRSPIISAVIGETGRSFSFGIDSFSLLEASSYLYRAHSSHFRRSAWDDAPTPYGYNQWQRQRDEQNPCNGWSIGKVEWSKGENFSYYSIVSYRIGVKWSLHALTQNVDYKAFPSENNFAVTTVTLSHH